MSRIKHFDSTMVYITKGKYVYFFLPFLLFLPFDDFFILKKVNLDCYELVFVTLVIIFHF